MASKACGSTRRRVRRREFLAAGLGVLAAPVRGAAQPAPKLPRVGFLFSFTPASGRHLWDACRRGLRELGYVEDRTIVLLPRLELLAEVLRTVPRVAVLTNPDNSSHVVFLEETRTAGERLGIPRQKLEARNADGIRQALQGGGAAAALIVFDDPVLWSHRQLIVELAASRRTPAMDGYSEFVDGGG